MFTVFKNIPFLFQPLSKFVLDVKCLLCLQAALNFRDGVVHNIETVHLNHRFPVYGSGRPRGVTKYVPEEGNTHTQSHSACIPSFPCTLTGQAPCCGTPGHLGSPGCTQFSDAGSCGGHFFLACWHREGGRHGEVQKAGSS